MPQNANLECPIPSLYAGVKPIRDVSGTRDVFQLMPHRKFQIAQSYRSIAKEAEL
jgi:hypothetical protein